MASKAEAVEVEAEVVEDGGLAVTFTPAAIDANFEALDERVSGMIAGYAEAEYDMSKPENIRQAKRDRTYLNGIAKEIDERRKAVKREYMRPYEEFEARANAIAAKVKDASSNIKRQLDEAEERRVAAAYEELSRHYMEIADLLAPVVPYERIHERKWTNKTFGEVKAKQALEEKVEGIARDWGVLKAQHGMKHYETAERAFFETLDLGEALKAAREAQEADERIAEMKRAVDPAPWDSGKHSPAPQDAAQETSGPLPEPEGEAPTAAPAPVPPAPIIAPGRDEVRKPWVVIVPDATRSDMEGLAKILRMSNVTGSIMQGTLAQVYERVTANVR